MTNHTTEAPPRHTSGRRRLVRILLATSPAWLLLGAFVVIQYSSSSRLRRAIADADRLDPGWRMGALESKRISLSDAENPALLVRQVAATPPASRKSASEDATPVEPETSKKALLAAADLDRRLAELPPAVRLPDDVAAGLRAEIEDRAAALALARPLSDTGEGHYAIQYNSMLYSTLLPHAQEARGVARLLQKDSLWRADRGDIDGAIDSARGVLGVARSFGNEPFAISQLVRMACESVAMDCFERALSHGEPSAVALARIQADLAREERQPLLLYALRGERAVMFETFDQLASGQINPSAFGNSVPGGSGVLEAALRFGAFGRYNQGLALDMLNQAVEISKRPISEQRPHWDRWAKDSRPSGSLAKLVGLLAYMLAPAGESVAAAHQRTRTVLTIGQAMAACERYRLAHKRWPDRLDDLVPTYLPVPLVDPYDGKPLRMLRTEDGLVIYAVGADLKDDRGKLHPKRIPNPGFDVGFRLWDVPRRHQPLDETKAGNDDSSSEIKKARP